MFKGEDQSKKNEMNEVRLKFGVKFFKHFSELIHNRCIFLLCNTTTPVVYCSSAFNLKHFYQYCALFLVSDCQKNTQLRSMTILTTHFENSAN